MSIFTKKEVQSIHQFSVKDTKGNTVHLADYEGKVLLIINTASQCVFTPQLEAMQDLYEEFKGEDFEILAFPSDDFAGQEPLKGMEIEEFCTLNYKTAFPIFDKIHVKGKNTHEVFDFLSNKSKNGKVNSSPKWNFHKYIVDKEGRVHTYFYPMTSPTASKVKKVIKKLLDQ